MAQLKTILAVVREALIAGAESRQGLVAQEQEERQEEMGMMEKATQETEAQEEARVAQELLTEEQEAQEL